MKSGNKFELQKPVWPEGRYWAVLTPSGRVARRKHGLSVFDSYEDACAQLKPGYCVVALDLLRGSVVALLEDGA